MTAAGTSGSDAGLIFPAEMYWAVEDRSSHPPVDEYLTQIPPCVGQRPIKSSIPSPSRSPEVIIVASEAICTQAPVSEFR